mgnify:CR=1 FL=1
MVFTPVIIQPIMHSIIVTAIFLLVSTQAFANTLQGKVINVTDGDTVTILDEQGLKHPIRLVGIDAPEKGQPYGEASTQNLIELVSGKTVTIEYEKRDRYKRIVGKVLVDPPGEVFCLAIGCVKKIDAGLEQVMAGLAWHYKKHQNEQSEKDREEYSAAESVARGQQLGLWKEK